LVDPESVSSDQSAVKCAVLSASFEQSVTQQLLR